ncbi:uncharacterized protein A1O5_11012 [Cladophialophora psammophila CBS 110553]|uniref:Metallo-beta-lactamase domain-containing protein n=1 Tax=Cladophialophora psammophila CBS 110553 TaxID=1182543 RepID=W9WMA4_9EURO|nr:uncharacterized protein A1O5_11012 [Cladophialophora psammophila CBS 110553]EXJ65771.1 hypothetical protein A1O5_11012 [Cladophialophora psammophila CBS 110553]
MTFWNHLFTVPTGGIAIVKIIDTTSRIANSSVDYLMVPPMKGFSKMPTHPSWSFLIENPSGTRVLFDLGIAIDWRQYAPIVSDRITTNGWHITADRSVADIIEDGGVPRESINSIIWSLVFGNLRAFDFFGDGSFYLLDTPGHSVGHLGGLVRTTKNPDTFIFMGGDLCHHAGEVRPSKYKPLPNEMAPEILPEFLRQVCPGAVLEELLTSRSRAADQSFFDPHLGSDIPEAIRTIGKVQEADANDNVLFLYAHDTSLLDGMVDLFPQVANNWKKNGWRTKLYWHFLGDFREALGLLDNA